MIFLLSLRFIAIIVIKTKIIIFNPHKPNLSFFNKLVGNLSEISLA